MAVETATMNLSEHEEWRPVVGWEDYYEVSSLGRVRSKDRLRVQRTPGDLGMFVRWEVGKLLMPALSHGYPFIVMSGGGRRKNAMVHIMVCEAFHGARPGRFDAAHNDGNRANARADNLRWASRVDNKADELRHGTRNRGERHGHSKLTDQAVRFIRSESGMTDLQLSKRFGVTEGVIWHARTGRTWSHLT